MPAPPAYCDGRISLSQYILPTNATGTFASVSYDRLEYAARDEPYYKAFQNCCHRGKVHEVEGDGCALWCKIPPNTDSDEFADCVYDFTDELGESNNGFMSFFEDLVGGENDGGDENDENDDSHDNEAGNEDDEQNGDEDGNDDDNGGGDEHQNDEVEQGDNEGSAAMTRPSLSGMLLLALFGYFALSG